MSVNYSWQHSLASYIVELNEFDQNYDVLEVESAFEALFLPLSNALTEATQALNARAGDQLGIRVNGYTVDGNEVNINISFRPFETISVVEILGMIEDALNSRATIELPLFLVFTLNPAIRLEALQGKGKNVVKFEGDFNVFARKKKSIVQINPANDEVNKGENCFAQWIILGLAHLIFLGRLQPIPELELTDKTYNKLTKSAGKFMIRKRLSLKLMEQEGFTQTSDEVLRRIEARFGVHLVLFSIKSMICEYPPQSWLPYQDLKETICGLLTGNGFADWKHVDLITKPTAFHPETDHKSFRFCYYCVRPYKRKQGCDVKECKEDRSPRCSFCHRCGGNACPTCETEECGYSSSRFIADEEECLPFVRKKKCSKCYHTLFSPKCQELHLSCCKVTHCKRCPECGNKVHAGLKCHEQRCYFCSDKFMKNELSLHECYIKPEKLKENKSILASYDFECCIGENNVHVPYLCTVWFPACHPQEEMLALKYPFERRSDGTRVFVFWGLGNPDSSTGVYQFFEFCADPMMKGTVFWAHNARSYDAIIVKCYFAKYMQQYSIDIMRGLKIMAARYTDLEIEFRDSLSFIPSSLRSMSEDFGITVENEVNGVIEAGGKDFFPHSYVTEAFLREAEQSQFITPKPPVEEFIPDYRSGRAGDREEQEYHIWVEQNYNQWGDYWNVRTEAVKYCIKDTVLLGKVLVKFRDQLTQMTATIPRPAGVEIQQFDALAYITLPSAMMSFFLSQMLEDKSIAVIHSAIALMRREAETWFLWLESMEFESLAPRPLPPNHQLEFFDSGCQAVSSSMEDRYVFLDCYEHGCTRCFASYQRNIIKNRTFGELWHQTQADLIQVRSNCRNLNCIWTHEWEKIKCEKAFLQWYASFRIEEKIPLFPRDAYKGGKVECFKICYPGEIQMSDFVSQYPTTLLGSSYDPMDVDGDPQKTLDWPFPVGIPIRTFRPEIQQSDAYISSSQKLGIIKCRVICPTDLYAPFLGYKVSSRLSSAAYEVLYGCCRSCMEERLFPCTHSSIEERSFVGTWTISEVRYAISQLNYSIVEIVEIWEYPQQSMNLFKSFIAPFMVEKIRSKRAGLVTDQGEFTEKGHKLNDYVFELIGRRLTPDEIEDNPARRQVAKLAQNSFTGKWGEIEVHRSVRTFTEKQMVESRKLLTDPSIRLIFAQVLDKQGDLVVIEYEPKFQCSRSARRKNDIIVAHITAYGRLMLSRLEKVLGRDLLYEDTDSAFHTRLLEPKYRDGYRTGDLELELKLGTNWVCCGRKWYAYLKDGQPVSKIKGFTLKRSNASLFQPSNLFKLFVECKLAYDGVEDEEDLEPKVFNKLHAPAITVEQRLFKTVQDSAVEMRKQTHVSMKKAQFQICSQKRFIVFNEQEGLDTSHLSFVDTLPFGFKIQ